MKGPRFALREATADCHQGVDAIFGRFDLNDRADYGRFLSAHARAFLPVEAALDAAGAQALLADWPERRRGDRLRADLAALGMAVPAPLPFRTPPSPAALWGTLYVMEGSRLGGAMLSRGVGAGLSKTYLDPGRSGDGWRNFLAALEVSLCNEADLMAAAQAARSLFATFEQAARTELEATAE